MRLSDVLSTTPNLEFQEIEGFLEKKLAREKQSNIDIGSIALPFFCQQCNGIYTFCHHGKIFCIGVNDNSVSIDCVLTCSRCQDANVPTWFLIMSKEDMALRPLVVRIQKRSFKLSDSVSLPSESQEDFKELFNNAQLAYSEGLGAGSVIYLRKILEIITFRIAEIEQISLNNSRGNRKNFRTLLEEVDEARQIIPPQFSTNGYQLFSDLSGIIHGATSEQTALDKYPALERLVISVIDNVKNDQEIASAIDSLGWNEAGDNS